MTSFAALIDHPSRIAEVRRAAHKLAVQAGFDATSSEKVSIVVTEAGTNLLKHAGRGQMFIRAVEFEEQIEIEMLALDNGPGIQDVEMSSRDGYSTTGTSGTGLGAIARLARHWDLYSAPGAGSALLARLAPGSNGRPTGQREIGIVQIPKPGEEVCGDEWGAYVSTEYKTVLLADGLGHGPEAAKAARCAVEILNNHPDLRPGELIETVHQMLRSTRGAAVAAARLDNDQRIITFAGLGNIGGGVYQSDLVRHMVSINGTAGVDARHIREFTYPWPEGALVILHSDGIGTHWSIQDYPGLATRDPALIAGVIYRDHARGNDDATIVVSK